MKTIIVISLLFALATANWSFTVSTVNVNSPSTGSTEEEFANNLRNDILNAPQPDGYCTVENPTLPFTNQGLCGGPNSNIGFHYEFKWGTSWGAQTVRFQMGFDMGWGGAVNFNGDWIYIRTDDIWWGGSDWANGDVWDITVETDSVENQIDIFGSEGCCDGANNIRYQLTDPSLPSNDPSEWRSLNDWQETQSFCCCMASASDPCTCDSEEDYKGDNCAEVCNGYPYCPTDYQECDEVTFFSECHGWGEEMVINGAADCLSWEPKGICVPEHKSVTLYNMCGFEGQEVTFSESNFCIDDIDYSLLAKQGVSVSGNKKHLKTAEPIKFEINDY